MHTFINEFKTFAVRGNVMDLAVAVVIGGAFGAIVSSFVDDIIMPLVGVLVGGVDFSALVWTVQEASAEHAAVTVNYGLFINSVVTFAIVAGAVFAAVKGINGLKRTEKVAPSAPPAPSREEVLLGEIRDLLKK